MCKIIQFPVKSAVSVTKAESNGYKNLKTLFEICDNIESCNFFLESAEQLRASGNITEGELYALRRIGRTKRLELANPPADPQPVTTPGTYAYTPEMGQQKPECQIEAQRSYYGKHFYLDTPLELKGRGITFIKKYSEKDFVVPNNYRIGWNEYQVTELAFEKIKKSYTVSMECFLD